MVKIPGVPAAKAFQHIHPNNPLNKLSRPDREILYSLLLLDASMDRIPKEHSKDHSAEKLAKLAADANRIAAEFDSVVFNDGLYSDIFGHLAGEYRDAPEQFMALTQLVGGILDMLGKPGHMERNERNTFFILATEFVRLRTGEYYDEHLADLYQFIWERSADYPAETIRKRRARFQKAYPDLHAEIVKLAMRSCESRPARSPSQAERLRMTGGRRPC